MNSTTSTRRPPPRISASVYVPLRPDGGVLTVETVRQASWRLAPGARVVLSIYGLRSWEAGVPELMGRILADCGAGEVYVQASTSSARLEELRSAIARAADEWCAAQ